MVDFNIFLQRMQVLASFYGRELNDAHIALYYRTVSERMTTEQFEHACDRVFVEERFFPVPAVLIEKVFGASSPAEISWARIVNAVDGGAEAELSCRDAFALRSIGGLRHLREISLTDRQWVKKDYLSYWESATSVKSLPPAQVLNPKAMPGRDVFLLTEDVRLSITQELIRLGMSSVLPNEWQDSKRVPIVSDLSDADAGEYLAYLKSLEVVA